jgi:hypothetical protein
MRASIYNAMPEQGVQALARFHARFPAAPWLSAASRLQERKKACEGAEVGCRQGGRGKSSPTAKRRRPRAVRAQIDGIDRRSRR